MVVLVILVTVVHCVIIIICFWQNDATIFRYFLLRSFVDR